jgi:hypothetical protein
MDSYLFALNSHCLTVITPFDIGRDNSTWSTAGITTTTSSAGQLSINKEYR